MSQSKPITDKPVLVTGATGYVASHLVEQLLLAGYKVRGTVRNKKKTDSYSYLLALPFAPQNLEIVEANLLSADGWEAAVSGCEIVHHTASPYVLEVRDPEKDLLQPAVEGVRHVFDACVKVGGVKKIVLTSSCVAIGDTWRNDHTYTENDWNTESTLDKNPYYYSKVRAEKFATEYLEKLPADQKIEMAVINPFAVIGPSHRPEVNQSVSTIQRMMNGDVPGLLDISIGYVDVRDVAIAHVNAQQPGITGRFILSEGTYSWADIAKVCRQYYPEHPIPWLQLPNWGVKMVLPFYPKGERDFVLSSLGHRANMDNSRSRNVLGVEYRKMEVTIKECCQDLIDQKFVRPVRKGWCCSK
eukprot:GDKI01006308.1.p1 GENE.GDKI01006308.1~~GDKI01006308.1.p1  ORF type:complete len:357 (-),score=85.82 GDKI01006308.1:179-1249(-)